MIIASHAQALSDSSRLQKQFVFQQPKLFISPFIRVLPQGFAVQHLPFFCDKEYKLEKWSKIPFRFRLGSVEYCDKMEGKYK